MLLLHGSNSSLQTWEPLAERLGGDYRIVTLDLPGHGLPGGTPDRDYGASGMIAAVDVVQAPLARAHFILAGTSLGGGVALGTAHAGPGQHIGEHWGCGGVGTSGDISGVS